MSFTGIRLQNFRSYSDQSFEFGSGVNVVVGPNASGKTNLLEALYVASRGKSFKGRDIEVIRTNQPWARIDAWFDGGSVTIKIKQSQDAKSEKTIALGPNKQFARLPARYHKPVVLFVPDHLRLLQGSPALRREYIDNLIVQLNPERQRAFTRYSRALRQRNVLLKQSSSPQDELFVWGVQLGRYGAQIAEWRYELVERVNQSLEQTLESLSGKTRLRVTLETSLGNRQNYASLFTKHLQSNTDAQAGFTTRGPHRDDMRIELRGVDSALTASRGETRSIVLALKVLEANMLEDKFGFSPLLLLDDVFSELDGSRRDKLSQLLDQNQTLITTTDADSIAIKSFKDAQFIAVS
jgi:DNA replication and repair protein RecF